MKHAHNPDIVPEIKHSNPETEQLIDAAQQNRSQTDLR